VPLTTIQVAALVLGIVVAGLGLAVMRGRPRHAPAEPDPAREVPGPRGLSEPTRLAIGLSMMVAGYHVVAYTAPLTWSMIQVPRDRWWILAAGIALTLLGSLVADAIERRHS
jgi:hypothetical protein